MALTPLPPIPVEPSTEMLHGVSVTDPYCWPEDQNSAQTRKFFEEPMAYPRACFDAILGTGRIRKRSAELLAPEVRNRYFHLNFACHSLRAVICFNVNAQGRQEAPANAREMIVLSDRLQLPL